MVSRDLAVEMLAPVMLWSRVVQHWTEGSCEGEPIENRALDKGLWEQGCEVGPWEGARG